MLALAMSAGYIILAAGRVDVESLRRYCARRGVMHEFALSLSTVVLFTCGTFAAASILKSAGSRLKVFPP